MSNLYGHPGTRFECLESDVQIGQFAAGLLDVTDQLMEAMADSNPASRADRVVKAVDALYRNQEVVYTEWNGMWREIVGREFAERRGRDA